MRCNSGRPRSLRILMPCKRIPASCCHMMSPWENAKMTSVVCNALCTASVSWKRDVMGIKMLNIQFQSTEILVNEKSLFGRDISGRSNVFPLIKSKDVHEKTPRYEWCQLRLNGLQAIMCKVKCDDLQGFSNHATECRPNFRLGRQLGQPNVTYPSLLLTYRTLRKYFVYFRLRHMTLMLQT